MEMKYIYLSKKGTIYKNLITSAIICFLVFYEFIIISIKERTEFDSIGVTRDFLLIIIAFWGIHNYRRSSIHLYFILIASYGTVLWNLDVRPFANLVSAIIAGITIGASRSPHGKILNALIIICSASIIYQAVNITEFYQFWFYDYLNNKQGDEFLATENAYFRDGKIRPTGVMVSPSIMGLALIGLAYLYRMSSGQGKYPYLIYAMVGICLFLIQTKALLIGSVVLLFIDINIKNINGKRIALLYLAAAVTTYFSVIFSNDPSGYVRVLLLQSVFEYISEGIMFPYLQVGQMVYVDSQLVGFFYLTGIPGLALLFWLYIRAFKGIESINHLHTFNYCCFGLFISAFQWSGDTFGLLASFYLLGTILKKNHYV
jgi:hypothetical protein